MTKRNIFTNQDIEKLTFALDSAQAPERHLKKNEALDLIAHKLKAARSRGHTLESLITLLASNGLHTHPRAVSQAIARLDSSKPIRKRKTPETNL